jgi:hypothetical protein
MDKGFLLTRNQRIIIDGLHKAYLERKYDVHREELLKKIGSPSSRLRDSFRHANR